MTTDQSQTLGGLVRRYRLDIGLTQSELAGKVGCSLNHIGMIENGRRGTSAYLTKRLIQELGLDLPGREQKRDLLRRAASRFSTAISVKVDRGEAPHPDPFYGREAECNQLRQWIVGDHCRLVAIVGFGGIGKSSLAAKMIEQLKDKFTYVFWRSLQNALPPGQFLRECLQFLSDYPESDLPKDIDPTSLLIEELREHKCLLILDNMEAILQEGSQTSHYQEEYEGYGRLLQRIGETDHKSCLLLASQEQLKEVAYLQETTGYVRLLRLSGVEQDVGREIIKNKGLFGPEKSWNELIHLYAGNPLALKIIAESIREVFGGDIIEFLKGQAAVFGGIRDFLEQQLQPLSPLTKEIMYWLAIEREPVSLKDLQEDLVHTLQRGAVPEALEVLLRRSMVERSIVETSVRAGFTLLPVIMEYMTNKLVEQVIEEIDTGEIRMLASHALIQAQAKDYIREIQIRFILVPIKEQLLTKYGKDGTEQRLKNALFGLRTMEPRRQGYAAGNVLNLLIHLESDLRGYDFSHLKIRQAYLQNADLRGVNFAHAEFEQSAFTDIFGSILSVAFTRDGKHLAAGTANGEIRLWQANGGIPQLTYQGHTQWVFALAFSPTEEVLASCSGDQTIRLWSISTGQCLNVLCGHTAWVRSVAFSPDGKLLASCSEDKEIRLWDVRTGQCRQTLSRHSSWVRSVAFSPDGKIIASGSAGTTVRLWDVGTGSLLATLHGHTEGVWSVAFSPDGTLLASGSEDMTIRLWDMKTRQTREILRGHTGAVRPLSFSPDGTKLASCSEDTTVRVWDVNKGELLKTFQGHKSWTRSVDFSPDGHTLASGSEDQTVRLWDVNTGHCLKVLQGHTHRIRSIAFSPGGDRLVSCSEDTTVSLWDINLGECIRVLRGHTSRVRAVAFNPNGNVVASGSDDRTIRLWDTSTGKCLNPPLEGHTNSVRSVAYSPDGKTIASGSDDRTIRLWDVNTKKCLNAFEGHDNRVRAVAFSPDGRTMASGSEDTTVRLWNVDTGECLYVLTGHRNRVWAVAFSPDGRTVASGSEDTTVRLWNVDTGECLYVLNGHEKLVWAVAFSPGSEIVASGSEDRTIWLWQASDGSKIRKFEQQDAAQKVRSVAFSPDGNMLASASNDGTIKLWEMRTGRYLKTFMKGNGPYEGMDITDIQGLTEAQKATLRVLGAIGD